MTSGRTLKADIIKRTASVTRLYTVLCFHSYGIIQGTGQVNIDANIPHEQVLILRKRNREATRKFPLRCKIKYVFGLILLSLFCEFSSAYHIAVVTQ